MGPPRASVLGGPAGRSPPVKNEEADNHESRTCECGGRGRREHPDEQRMAARRTELRGGVRRVASMAQGHADLERPSGERNGQQSQPVHRLPDDRDLHARVRLPALRSPRLLRRRRRRGEHLRDVRQQVAGAPLAGQDRPVELAGVLRLRTRRRGHSGGGRPGGGAGGRRHRIVRGHRVEQDRARFPRERPAAVRGQALPAIRRIR